jgi:hypothetical protein
MSDVLSRFVASLVVLVIAVPTILWSFGIELEFKEILTKVGPWVLVALTAAIIAAIWRKS